MTFTKQRWWPLTGYLTEFMINNNCKNFSIHWKDTDKTTPHNGLVLQSYQARTITDKAI